MGVGGPGSVLAVARHDGDRDLRYVMRDSVPARIDGVVLISGDTLLRLRSESRASSSPSHSQPPMRYRFDRIATQVEIAGYVTPEGKWHAWEGTARARGGSLELRAPTVRARGLRRGWSGDTLRLPWRMSPGWTSWIRVRWARRWAWHWESR